MTEAYTQKYYPVNTQIHDAHTYAHTHNFKMDIAAKFRERLAAEGFNPTSLSRVSGVPQPTILRIAKGQVTPDIATLKKLAPHLRTTAGELATGVPTVQSNIAQYKVTNRAVPVLSLIRASELSDINCHYEPDEGDRFETPDHKLGPRGWAHVVSGTSMDDGTERGFPEGCLIFCDPDRAPKPNDYVIAKDVNGQRATFKQLVHEDGRWFLRPLNRQFPVIEIDGPELRVIAVVTETRPQSRRLV